MAKKIMSNENRMCQDNLPVIYYLNKRPTLNIVNNRAGCENITIAAQIVVYHGINNDNCHCISTIIRCLL